MNIIKIESIIGDFKITNNRLKQDLIYYFKWHFLC